MKNLAVKTTNLVIFLVVVVISLCVLVAAPTLAKTHELRVATYVPPVVHLAKAIDWWAAELQKRTNGALKVTVFHAQTLGKVRDSLDMLESGTADVVMLPAPAFPGRFPVSELVADTPLLRGNIRLANEVLNQLLMDGLLKEFNKYKVICWFNIDTMMLFTTKKVTTLEELKGLKIRARGRASTDIVERLGASPVALEVGELYTSLERGIVDGVTTSITAFSMMKLFEVCKYLVDEPLYGGLVPILMSKRSWNKLPSDIKLIIEQVNKELAYTFFNFTWKEMKKGYEIASQGGREITKLSPKEQERWQKTIRPVTDAALARINEKGLPGEKIMAKSQDVLDFWKLSGLR
jgi:TRAP-type C4-dicarboxylate transport system substrate-binding protein